jgi:hypothetical protein
VTRLSTSKHRGYYHVAQAACHTPLLFNSQNLSSIRSATLFQAHCEEESFNKTPFVSMHPDIPKTSIEPLTDTLKRQDVPETFSPDAGSALRSLER